MTSGNRSDEPIAYRDNQALEHLGHIADYFLVHDRPIHMRCDDSVVRHAVGGPYPVRRSRGQAPAPLQLAHSVSRHTLACGGELKNTFCVARGHHAFLSHHIGDLENYETLCSFEEGVRHYRTLFDVQPELVVYDLHPEYLSTKYARRLEEEGMAAVGVQHHHAHIASCLADNGIAGPVIGLALDGTGWGPDGTIWGGEILVAGLAGFRRAGHLRPVPLPGGAAAIREPWRMAAAYLRQGFGAEAAALDLPFVRETAARWGPVLELAAKGINAPLTSSAGRLFDAAAALAGLRGKVNYEGQAAIELEQAADPAEMSGYCCPVRDGSGTLVLDGVDLLRSMAEELVGRVPLPTVAARFHNGLAAALVESCRLVREATGREQVALSGGTFQNLLLLERVTAGLEAQSFTVHRHRRVPANDGGISLGQAMVAGARLRR